MARGRWRGEDAARGGRLRTSAAVFAFADTLSDQQIADVWAYVGTL